MRLVIALLIGSIVMAALLLLREGTSPAPRRAENRESRGEQSREGESESPPMREFLTRVYGKDPSQVTAEELESWRTQFETLPRERGQGIAAGTAWECIGPYTLNTGGPVNWTGRVRDIEAPDAIHPLRVAAATGGLWEWRVIGIIPVAVPLTENLDTQVVSTFANHPTNPNYIVLGTGEAGTNIPGTGIHYTTDRGVTWIRSVFTNSPPPPQVYQVRFAPDGTTAHAVTVLGYYRSDDMGATWTRRSALMTTDIALHSTNPNFLYATVAGIGEGVYSSTDRGTTWSKIFGVASTDTVGFGSITTTPADPHRIYIALSNQFQNTLGVWRSTDEGKVWTLLKPGTVMAGMGDYCNVVTASPVDANVVLVGAFSLHRSTNGGNSWSDITYAEHIHADHHAFAWGTNGVRTLYVGNDGGVAVSTNDGATWSTSTNVYPITQFYSIDVGRNDGAVADGGVGVIAGGNQDNGYAVTVNGGDTWFSPACCDGGSVTIDPADPDVMLGTRGLMSPPLVFDRERSLNRGATWATINSGLVGASTSLPQVRNDLVSPVRYYTHEGSFVFYSSNQGSSWSRLNLTGFGRNIWDMTVSRYSTPAATVYACLKSGYTGNRLWVRDGPSGTWFERSTGLPEVDVQKVATSLSDPARCYAIMKGTGTPGQKIFKSTNRGATWTNITGGLPDIPLTDLVESPSNANILIAASLFGCVRTTDAGATWRVWDDGMPRSTFVNSLAVRDKRATEMGLLSIVAGTYGRSVWKRVIYGEDVVGVSRIPENENRITLSPNPLRGTSQVRFTMPAAGIAHTRVFDASGRLVETLAEGPIEAGEHRVSLSAQRLRPGVYFLRHETARQASTLKFTVAR
jgi:photosystem II stability/assembly factor-like uncharacterized protein